MKINVIFPIAGPLNGVKVITREILERFKKQNVDFRLIDTSQAKAYSQFGKFSFAKVFNFIQILTQLRTIRKKEIVYMNFTAHGYAYIRDYIIVRFLLLKKCNITIHIHESTLDKLKKKSTIKVLSKLKILLINQGQYEDLKPYYSNCSILKNALPDYFEQEKFEIKNTNNEKIKLLVISNLSKPKGKPLLATFVQEIEKNKLPYEITVCGGVLDETSSAIIVELKNKPFIKLLEPIFDMKQKMELYQNHDFLLFLSDENYEVYPLVYIESLMCGLPILSTKQVVSSEVISDNGSHFIADSLEKTITKLLENNTVSDLKTKARQKYEKDYDFDTFTSQLLTLIYAPQN